jgi:hypothetical protein
MVKQLRYTGLKKICKKLLEVPLVALYGNYLDM